MVERRGPKQFYSGRELERDVLGVPKLPKEYEWQYRQATAKTGGYLPMRKAQALIREHDTDDPTNPRKEFAKDLRLEICEALDLEGKDAEIVRFYSAIGTPLDRYHGVDAWVEIDLPDEKSKRTLHAEATLDVTQREEKIAEGHKADVIIGDIPAPGSKNYLDAVARYGKEVSDVLVERLRAAAGQGTPQVYHKKSFSLNGEEGRSQTA